MLSKCVIGVDTSNYTTSVAIIGTDRTLYANLKIPLSVESGARGLRQSDALFLHTKNLPEIFSEVRSVIAKEQLSPIAVGVSSRPRNQDGSYMPCFLAGRSVACAIAACENIPLYEVSHQCGHIAAAIFSSGADCLFDADRFGAFHVSGGTTELVLARPTNLGFACDIVGGTADLNAGQAIDRTGVMMGLAFPCGPEMERLALRNTVKIPKDKLSLKDCDFNLSGLENKAAKLYSQTESRELVSAYVLDFVGRAIVASSLAFVERYGNLPMVFAGGVMSNSIIKSQIASHIEHAYFAEPAMSADNAVGVAVLACRAHTERTL